MEFLKTCNTNAQAIGDFEAIAYQAFSITRTTTPTSSRTRDWNTSEDIRAVEAQLRQDLQLVAQDASRPWLWLFKPTTVDKLEPNDAEPPELDGYRLHSEQTGCTKAIDLVRPPMRPGNPNTTATSTNSPSATQPQRGLHAGSARSSQGNSQPQASDSPSPPDCFTIYELFTSSVIALISFNVVKDCNVTALNYRTFVSKACKRSDEDPYETEAPAPVHRLTSVNVHWASSGTLLVSTYTDYKTDIRCIGDISTQAEEKWLTGKCIRVAPNGLLATISSFDDPLDSIIEEIGLRHRKRTRLATLEQSIESWKSSVKRWLGWKGYALPNLEKKSSWVRIRTTLTNSPTTSSPAFAGSDRDVLWPRALCFFHSSEEHDMTSADSTVGGHSMLRWYETPESMGFKDPLDAAQEWFLGKPDRDKILEARRKAKKAEEDSARRKDEQQNLFPSSPLNARGGAYGDLHAVGGVYPTPPDGVAPGTAVSHSDTPSVSGTVSNVILAPGGSNPAINLSAPQADTKMDEQQMPSTSPVVPSAPDNFNVSSGNDDLFGDMDEDGYGGDRINDDDFDFFDEPDDNDVDMLDAPALPETNVVPTDTSHEQESQAAAEHPPEEDSSDPFAALESALATASEPAMDVEKEDKGKQPMTTEMPLIESPDLSDEKSVAPIAKAKVSFSKEPTPPLSPSAISKALQPSPPKKLASHTRPNQPVDTKNDAHFSPVVFSRKMSMSDAKYQDGRFSAHRPVDSVNQNSSSPSPGPRPVVTQTKSLRDIPLLSKLRITVGAASTNQIPEIASLARAASENSDSSDISDESDEDSGEGEEEEAGTTPAAIIGGLIMPAKRKLQSDGNATPLSVTSFADSMGGDWHDLHGLQVDELNLTSFEPSLWDWSLVHFPSPVERRTAGARYSLPSLHASPAQMPDTPTSQPEMSYEVSEEKPLSAKDSISITQIVTDQIVKTTLDLLGEGLPFEKEPVNEAIAETRWHTVIKEIFPAAAECDLPTLAGVHEVFQDYAALAKAQQRPAARKNDGPAVTGSHLYQINAPFLRVRRAETHWDLLPPAVAFWEPLGLSPISSPKNVVTFCIYPHSDALRPCLENFLLNLQLAYDSCKLGTHSRVETVVEFEGGLVPVRANSTVTPAESFKLLKETCVQLGKLLAIQHAKIREQQDSKIDAFVIYMVDPFGGPSALWELCSAFWVLFQAYGQGSPGRPDQPQKPDLVLQVVPMKYIASFDTPVILDPSTYFSLAREVYDRCPPSAPSGDKTSLSIYAAPAFHLEETLPRNIPFKLISEPAQDLLRENTYMHLGYAISLDGTWVTAAWTDSCGKSQAVVSYHLGTRMFREVAKEIWQTTIEILQSRRVNWRVCIAKAGVLEREELETWVFLISCPTQINVFVTLLTAIDADPPYKFTPTMTGPSTAIGGSTNTPESTPQAGVSPSDLGPGLTPAATPSADPSATDPSADPEARLIDVTDETWGVILAHRLHNTQSTTQFSPALISGLLVKRGETQQTRNSISHPIPDPEPGPIVVAVNFLWIGAVGSTRAASSPFPPSSSGSTPSAASTSSDLPSPGASTLPNPYASNPGTPQSSGPAQDAGQRSTTSLMWTPTPQTRTTAEGLLKEVLGQFRALGLLAKLRGMRGTRNGTLPWHLVAAKRGVEGLSRIGGAV